MQCEWLTDLVNVLRPIERKIGHFGDVLLSKFPGLVQKKRNLTKQKQTTRNKMHKKKT